MTGFSFNATDELDKKEALLALSAKLNILIVTIVSAVIAPNAFDDLLACIAITAAMVAVGLFTWLCAFAFIAPTVFGVGEDIRTLLR